MIQIFITLSFVFIITLLILHRSVLPEGRKIPTIRDSGAAGSAICGSSSATSSASICFCALMALSSQISVVSGGGDIHGLPQHH